MRRPAFLSEKPSGFDVSIGGLVSALRVMRTKKGDPMGDRSAGRLGRHRRGSGLSGYLCESAATARSRCADLCERQARQRRIDDQDSGHRHLSDGTRQGNPEPHRDHSHQLRLGLQMTLPNSSNPSSTKKEGRRRSSLIARISGRTPSWFGRILM